MLVSTGMPYKVEHFWPGKALPPLAVLERFQDKMDEKTKPQGSLGRLESLALQLAQIQNSLSPQVLKPHILVFAGDHGIALEGVSAYPQDVTYQMVLNFLSGGAAINVLCHTHEIGLTIVDAGVIGDFPAHPKLVARKVARGTGNFLHGDAMNDDELLQTIASGRQLAAEQYERGSTVLGFGEMGIANTSSASILCHFLLNIPLADLVGTGTGLSEEGLALKQTILETSRAVFVNQLETGLVNNYDSLHQIIRRFGGFEIVMMASAMLEAARHGCAVLVDGFISTAAFLIAHAIDPLIKDHTIFSHVSAEKGHRAVFAAINADPLLSLGMRLGEGSGAALAIPILRSACAIMNDMASFKSAGVSTRLA